MSWGRAYIYSAIYSVMKLSDKASILQSVAYLMMIVCCNKHREGRLKQEMENMRQQNDWLNNELQEKIHELMNSRKEKVSHGYTDSVIICYWKVVSGVLESL